MRFFARQNVNDFILRVKSNSGRFDRMAQDDAFFRPATSRFPADHDLRRSICEFSDAGNNQIRQVGQDCEWRPVRCPAQAARPRFSVRGPFWRTISSSFTVFMPASCIVQAGVQPRSFPHNPFSGPRRTNQWAATLCAHLAGVQAWNHAGTLPQTRGTPTSLTGRLAFAFPSILPYHELVS
jgi:hypothetical protein